MEDYCDFFHVNKVKQSSSGVCDTRNYLCGLWSGVIRSLAVTVTTRRSTSKLAAN